MSTSEREASSKLKCDTCQRLVRRSHGPKCGHIQCYPCSSHATPQAHGCLVCQRNSLRPPNSPPKHDLKQYVCEPSTSHLDWSDPMSYFTPPTCPKQTNKPTEISFTGFGQTPEEPSVNTSEIENKMKDLKTEIMKEMRTEVDEKIKELIIEFSKEMDRLNKNEKMNSSALSVLFKKEKERETQWANQTTDCLSLKLAETKGPQQQEMAKDKMEDYKNLKMENEKMRRENSELKDELKNLKIKFEEVRSYSDRISETALLMEDHCRNKRQALAEVNEALITQLRGNEKLEMENERLITDLRGYEDLEMENETLTAQLRGYEDLEMENERLITDLRGYEDLKIEYERLITTFRSYENFKMENEEMNEENFELKHQLRIVEDELKRCKDKDEKRSGPIRFSEMDINSQGPRDRWAPRPSRNASASTKKKSSQWAPLEVSLEHERMSLLEKELMEMSKNHLKKIDNGGQSSPSDRVRDWEETWD